MTSVPEQHRQAAGQDALACAVITCSDTRTADNDRSGQLIMDQLVDAGHSVVRYKVVREDPTTIRQALEDIDGEASVILLSGGTGVGPRDNTTEAVDAFVERNLPGFGELFRSLSHAAIGASAMLSRATAGTKGKAVVFAMPGSTAAVKLAMERLILPEINHIVSQLEA